MSNPNSAHGYAELLRMALSDGLQELDCTIVQIPGEQNGHHGVVLATVRTSRGLFRALGEAGRDRLAMDEREHTLTVAEIRAKTRALGDAVGQPRFQAGEPGLGDAGRSTIASTPRAEAEPGRSNAVGAAPLGSRSPDSSGATPTAAAAHAPSAKAEIPALPLQETIVRQRPSGVEAAAPASIPEKVEAARSPTAGGNDDAGVARASSPARPPNRGNTIPMESLGPDMVSKLLQMTRRKASLEGSPATEEEAMRRLDSYFLRAFGHDVSEASRMEGQRVVQRLAADLARMNVDSGVGAGG